MTDRQRLLIALLSDPDSTRADLENMRRLELAAAVDLVGPDPVPRAS